MRPELLRRIAELTPRVYLERWSVATLIDSADSVPPSALDAFLLRPHAHSLRDLGEFSGTMSRGLRRLATKDLGPISTDLREARRLWQQWWEQQLTGQGGPISPELREAVRKFLQDVQTRRRNATYMLTEVGRGRITLVRGFVQYALTVRRELGLGLLLIGAGLAFLSFHRESATRLV